jgi:hypothetical protein
MLQCSLKIAQTRIAITSHPYQHTGYWLAGLIHVCPTVPDQYSGQWFVNTQKKNKLNTAWSLHLTNHTHTHTRARCVCVCVCVYVCVLTCLCAKKLCNKAKRFRTKGTKLLLNLYLQNVGSTKFCIERDRERESMPCVLISGKSGTKLLLFAKC